MPPICQIQFTDNLGNAVSKGFDVQADFQLTTALSIESSFGYTDARYTTNTYLGANTGPPVVERGDAVAGPNGIGTGYSIPPYSGATVSVDYKFQAFSYRSFVRGDLQYLGRQLAACRSGIHAHPRMMRPDCPRRGRLLCRCGPAPISATGASIYSSII